jgi:hypothetical protein
MTASFPPSLFLLSPFSDWSNAKALWTKSHPMNDLELLTQQVVMSTSAAEPGQTVWVYRGSMWVRSEPSIDPHAW